MQHLILHFQHGIEDVIPWCAFIQRVRPQLAHAGAGEFEGDDMAIGGGDCEAIFQGSDVEQLFAMLLPQLQTLPFLLKPARMAELIFGEIDSTAERRSLPLVC